MTTDDDRDDGQQWESEYAQWCAEQDDEDEVNAMLREAGDENER